MAGSPAPGRPGRWVCEIRSALRWSEPSARCRASTSGTAVAAVARHQPFDALGLVRREEPGLGEQRPDRAPRVVQQEQVVALGDDELDLRCDRDRARRSVPRSRGGTPVRTPFRGFRRGGGSCGSNPRRRTCPAPPCARCGPVGAARPARGGSRPCRPRRARAERVGQCPGERRLAGRGRADDAEHVALPAHGQPLGPASRSSNAVMSCSFLRSRSSMTACPPAAPVRRPPRWRSESGPSPSRSRTMATASAPCQTSPAPSVSRASTAGTGTSPERRPQWTAPRAGPRGGDHGGDAALVEAGFRRLKCAEQAATSTSGSSSSRTGFQLPASSTTGAPRLRGLGDRQRDRRIMAVKKHHVPLRPALPPTGCRSPAALRETTVRSPSRSRTATALTGGSRLGPVEGARSMTRTPCVSRSARRAPPAGAHRGTVSKVASAPSAAAATAAFVAGPPAATSTCSDCTFSPVRAAPRPAGRRPPCTVPPAAPSLQAGRRGSRPRPPRLRRSR